MEKVDLYDRFYVDVNVEIESAEKFNAFVLLLAENNYPFSIYTYDKEDKTIRSFGGLANSDLLEINLGQKRID